MERKKKDREDILFPRPTAKKQKALEHLRGFIFRHLKLLKTAVSNSAQRLLYQGDVVRYSLKGTGAVTYVIKTWKLYECWRGRHLFVMYQRNQEGDGHPTDQ